jgi:hypothetical protein
LPERTLRFSLNILKREGAISEILSLEDVRNKILKLNVGNKMLKMYGLPIG